MSDNGIAPEEAWEQALPIKGQDSGDVRQDQYQMPMVRAFYDEHQSGGWGLVNDEPIAFRVTGPPVIGDDKSSSAEARWYLPSPIGESSYS